MKNRMGRSMIGPLTLTRAVALWLATIFVVWVVLTVGWFAVKAWSVGSHHEALRAGIQGVNAAHRLEVSILGYRREDLLWHATGGSDRSHYRQRRDEYLAVARQAASGLAQYADTPQEKAIERRIQTTFQDLMTQIGIVSGKGPSPPEAEVRLSEEVLAAVRDFRHQQEAQMQHSIQEANHLYGAITYWMLGLSAATAVLLFGGALRFLRRVIRPVLALTRSAEAFGRGELAARASVLHEDELGTLARTFNSMAADIADREEERLRFVAMVAHDLKNPVYTIQLALGALGGPEVGEKERRSYVGGALEETKRLKRIVRDLTNDMQVATGRFSLAKTNVDLGLLVHRLVESQKEAWATHEIVVETAAGCVIEGDAERMERVVMNLFSNAIKYSPAHTRVTVRVAREDSHVQLTVSDQGPGIAKEDLLTIFQPFGRGRSANILAEGTGVGLYIVKQIVEAHGGRIEVHSAPGCGTTFVVELPPASIPQPA